MNKEAFPKPSNHRVAPNALFVSIPNRSWLEALTTYQRSRRKCYWG